MYLTSKNIPTVVTCAAVTVANSEISYNKLALENGGYPLGTVASFTCFDGFNLYGFESGTCLATGRFSQTPACGNEMDTLF